MNFAITCVGASTRDCHLKVKKPRGYSCMGGVSQNKHFLSVHVRMWTLSRSRRGRWRERQVVRESGLCAMRRGCVIGRRCRTSRSIVFPPIILSKLIYDRLFVVDSARACACARAGVRGACLRARRVLPADGASDDFSRNALVN